MPRQKKRHPACRMNLEMSRKVRDKLETLSDETDMSLAEVIRKSLAVYDLLWSEMKKGGTIVIRGPDGEKELIIV